MESAREHAALAGQQEGAAARLFGVPWERVDVYLFIVAPRPNNQCVGSKSGATTGNQHSISMEATLMVVVTDACKNSGGGHL